MTDSPIFNGMNETPIANRLKYGPAEEQTETIVPDYEQGYRKGWENAQTVIPEGETIDITPNNVIRNPNTRIGIGIALYIISMAAGLGALLFGIFPELAHGTDIPSRVIMFINGSVSLVSGGFGIVVTTPNVPVKRVK